MTEGPEGFEVRDLDTHLDERGTLTELYRLDWGEFNEKPRMAYTSTTHPGVVRAWHRHVEGQVDYWTVLSASIKIGVYDENNDTLATEVIGENQPALVRIPGEYWHGFKALGPDPAVLVNFPTALYDYDEPDEERVPWDCEWIPLDWMEEPHE